MKRLPHHPTKGPARGGRKRPRARSAGAGSFDFASFRASLSLHAKADYVRDAYHAVRTYLRKAGPVPLHPAAVTSYLAAQRARGLSLQTLHNIRCYLSAFFEFLRQNGRIKSNPAASVRLGRVPKPLPRWLNDEEIEQTLGAAEKAGFWPEVMLALCTGIRRGELARLQWTDVDWKRKTIQVRQPKNGDDREAPLSAGALEAIKRQRAKLNGCGCGGFAFVFPARARCYKGRNVRYTDRERSRDTWRTMAHALQAAVPKFNEGRGVGRAWHLLRHTFASRLAAANVSDRRIARLLGHRVVAMAARYAHLPADARDGAVELVIPGKVRAKVPDEGEKLLPGGMTMSTIVDRITKRIERLLPGLFDRALRKWERKGA